jgi:hypothetical protein
MAPHQLRERRFIPCFSESVNQMPIAERSQGLDSQAMNETVNGSLHD